MNAKRAAVSELTLRERQVLELIATGLTNRMIGHALGISHRTVETHRLRIMAKLGARTPLELGIVLGKLAALDT